MFKATASAFSQRNLCLLDTSWFSCQLLYVLPGFPSNFSACREINCLVIGYKGRSLICILISELQNEISIFLPWTDRHKSHCLQSLNTPHQIYRYWCRRERDHFLCHRNLKCKEKKKNQVWSSKANNMGWLHLNARSTITLLMKWFSPDIFCPSLSSVLHFFSSCSLGLSISPYSPQPHTHFLFFFSISQTVFPQKCPSNYAISWLWVGNIINLAPSDHKSVGQTSKLEFLQSMMQQSPQ